MDKFLYELAVNESRSHSHHVCWCYGLQSTDFWCLLAITENLTTSSLVLFTSNFVPRWLRKLGFDWRVAYRNRTLEMPFNDLAFQSLKNSQESTARIKHLLLVYLRLSKLFTTWSLQTDYRLKAFYNVLVNPSPFTPFEHNSTHTSASSDTQISLDLNFPLD